MSDKIKIMVGCNILTMIDGLAYPNHLQMWYRIGRDLGNNYEFYFHTPIRSSIDNMRNTTANLALLHDCKFIFFYDDDVILPVDTLSKLLSTYERTKAAVISGLTFIRGNRFKPMIFDKSGPILDYKSKVDKYGCVDCESLGFSCVLLDVEVMKYVITPYFVTGSQNTEDVYYCIKLKDMRPESKILCDTNIKTGHLVGKYMITEDNRDRIIKFEEEEFGIKEEELDHGIEYLEKIEKAISDEKELLELANKKIG